MLRRVTGRSALGAPLGGCLALLFGAWPAPAPVAAASRADPVEIRVLLARSRAPVSVEIRGHPVEVVASGSEWVSDGRRRARTLRFPARTRFRGRSYRGQVEVRRDGGRLLVINEVPLEEYTAGTLLREVYAGWEVAVLRAQAVAIRTYALYRRSRAEARGRPYHVEASQKGQVYGGVGAESERAWAVVRATRDEFLAWDGQPILAAFHSASGGRTASSEEVWGRPLPYLVSVAVTGEEDSPDTYWRARFSRRQIEASLANRALGDVQAVEILGRSESGRVERVRIRGSRSHLELSPKELRRALGVAELRSTLFEVRGEGDDFVFVGSGRGHGVGMSQWGARALARRGLGYREILHRFYPGTELHRLMTQQALPASYSGPGLAPVGAAP